MKNTNILNLTNIIVNFLNIGTNLLYLGGFLKSINGISRILCNVSILNSFSDSTTVGFILIDKESETDIKNGEVYLYF